ncbi:hypothetical protein C8R45DRAFT_1113799 [Mycena sanguinolenta]|nr:hypothetical protein C8R45DRAFT_1114560 [Mycena sanguinolenta]KAJ6451077.1 hypothetical protein C8R45DRAFT_1113799 [Mycena sanguinolenta]
MQRSALSGSSKENPWCLGEDGQLELKNKIEAEKLLRAIAARRRREREQNGTPGVLPPILLGAAPIGQGVSRQALGTPLRPLRINSGPSSSIRQDTVRRPGGHRDSTFMALREAARAQVQQVEAQHESGGRAPRAHALTHDDLYLDEVRPPSDIQPKDYHECPICRGLLSHPASYVLVADPFVVRY